MLDDAPATLRLPPGFFSGLFGIVLGALAAIELTPADVGATHALFEPALALSAGLLVGPSFRVSRDPRRALRAENLLLVGLIYWLLLDPLQSAYEFPSISQDEAQTAFAAIGMFAFMLWLGAGGRGWRPPALIREAAAATLTDRQLFLVTVACFLLGVFYYLWTANFDPSTIVSSLLASRFAAAWSRGGLGGWTAFVEHLVYFGYPVPALAVLLTRRLGLRNPRVIAAILMAAAIVAFSSQSGGRRIVGMLLGSALFSWMLTAGELRLKRVMVAAFGVVVIFAFLQTMLEYRMLGWEAYLNREPPSTIAPATGDSPTTLRVDDNLLRLTQIVQMFSGPQEFAGWTPVVYMLTRPAPRALWPGKPVDPGYSVAEYVGMAHVGLTASIVGDLYAIYGLAAVAVGGLLAGRLATMVNFVLRMPESSGRPIVFSLGLMTLFIALRAMHEFVLMSYGVFGWCLISKLLVSHGARPPRR